MSPYQVFDINFDQVVKFELKRNLSIFKAIAKKENEKIFGNEFFSIISFYDQLIDQLEDDKKRVIFLHPITTWWCQKIVYLYACLKNNKKFILDYDPTVASDQIPKDLILQFSRVLASVTAIDKELDLPTFNSLMHLPISNQNILISSEKKWSDIKNINFFSAKKKDENFFYNADDFIFNHILIQNIVFPNNIKAAPISLETENFIDVKKNFNNALDNLKEIWPEIYLCVKKYLRSIIFVRDPSISGNGNRSISCSSKDFSGAILISNSSLDLFIESIVHEVSHSILYSYMEMSKLTEQSLSLNDECIFYSPWRPDVRPAIGVLHACFVFFYVAKMYFNFFKLNKNKKFEEKSLKNIKRIIFAIDPLVNKVNWTPKGKDFILKLKSESLLMLNNFNKNLKLEIDEQIIQDYDNWKKNISLQK